MFAATRAALAARPGRAELAANLLAGLTVGIIAIPLSMALAIASGVPPQHGLYTAAIAGVVIALTGGSAVNVSGPTAAFVVVLLPVVEQFGLGGLLTAGLLAGAILVGLGLGRVGRLIEVVPHPVVAGFTAGIGVVIATLQIPDFLGLATGTLHGHYPEKLAAILTALPQADWREALVGGVTLAILLLWPRLHSPLPGHLVALFLAAAGAWLAGQLWDGFAVETLGSRYRWELDGLSGNGIPPFPPAFQWPWQQPGSDGAPLGFSFALVRDLLPAAFAIAVLGALESLLCAVAADGMTGRRHNPDDELVGQGLGNLVAPFFGGIPATAAIARTTASVRAGATLPLAAAVHGLVVLAALLWLAPLLSFIPMAAMAAMLLVVAWNMADVPHVLRLLRVGPRDDVVVLATCFALTVLFDMTLAVAVGMGLAAVLFIRRTVGMVNAQRVERTAHDRELPAGLALYDIDGPLFFASARKALRALADVTPDVRVVILDLSGVSLLDMSAILVMESIARDLESRRIGLVIAGLAPRMVLKLRRAGIRRRAGRVSYARNLAEAIAKAERLLATEAV